MKKVIVACLIAVGLVGCSEPVPQSQWVQTQFDLKQVQGLEDCKYFNKREHSFSTTELRKRIEAAEKAKRVPQQLNG